jgi:hypothetical protein
MPAKTALRKALTTTGDGAALLPYDLDPVLGEELLKLQPLFQLIQVVQAEAKTHEYNVRTSHPMGWFEGEATPANPKNGAYQRKTVSLKIARIWGSVTGFAQAMDERFIDALATELEGSLEGVADLQEFSSLWGTADDIGFSGDAFQYSGIMPRLFKFAPGNIIDAAGAKISLDHLDQALAKVRAYRGVSSDPLIWLVGLRMKQIIDGLQTKIQIPLTSVSLGDGQIKMDAYGGAGFFESDYVVPEDTSTSPVDLAGAGAVGGSLAPNTTYHYRIASVTAYGEQVAAADAQVATGAGDGSVDLTWTADTNALLYYIFRGSANNNHQLLDIIAAKTYDANGTVNGTVATYTDDGSKTPVAVKPLNTGEQNIPLINLNPRRGVALMGKIDDMGRPVDNLWSFIELARTKDTFDYMLKSYQAMRLCYPNLISVVRHVKLA